MFFNEIKSCKEKPQQGKVEAAWPQQGAPGLTCFEKLRLIWWASNAQGHFEGTRLLMKGTSVSQIMQNDKMGICQKLAVASILAQEGAMNFLKNMPLTFLLGLNIK